MVNNTNKHSPFLAEDEVRGLQQDAKRRRRHAFAPGTSRNHMTYFRTYVAFCSRYDLDYINPEPNTLCMYIEMLARTFKSAKAISNYVSGVALLHKLAGFAAPALEDFQVHLMLKGVTNTVGDNFSVKQPFTVEMMKAICTSCEKLGDIGMVCRCVFLFAFFGFLRASNLLASGSKSFSVRRQLCRGDVLIHPPGLVLIITWSKTRQSPGYRRLLALPAMPDHVLCPVKAFQALLQISKHQSQNAPLFLQPGTQKALSIPHVRVILASILDVLGYDSTRYSLHSFRKAGASVCYNAGIKLDAIMQHGDWKSESVWRYITPASTIQGSVAQSMAQAVASDAV